jgi:glutaredoxin
MIEIYTVPNCKDCKKAKRHLNDLGIEYKEINLKEKQNKEARAFYRSLGVKTAPIITNGDEWILTEYDADTLAELLEEK